MRGPSTYEVFERPSNESHGIYDTLDEARGCVEFYRLRDFEIWMGDHIVDEGAPQDAKLDEIRIQAVHCARAQCVAVHDYAPSRTPCQECIDAAKRVLASYATTFGASV